VIFLAVNCAPRLTAALLGLKRVGDLGNALPPDPTSLVLNGRALDYADLLLPPRLVEPLGLTRQDLPSVEIVGKVVESGASVYHLALDEADLNTLARRWFFPKGAIGGRFRDLWIDLQPGGLVLYADVNLGLRWQRMGLLLLHDGGLVLSPVGVVIKQELYALPDKGFLAQTLVRAQAYSERMLTSLMIVGPLPGKAQMAQVRFHADRIELCAQTDASEPPPPDTGWQALETGVEMREIDIAAKDMNERAIILRLDPAIVRFSVHYDPVNPAQVSEWVARLEPLVILNGGYFTEENDAIGLLVSQGEVCGKTLEDFAGMFAVTADGKVSIRWLQEHPYDAKESLTEALQSFPVLVKPGGVMGFPPDADQGNPARRTVVAHDDEGHVLIIVAPRGYLSLHELAVFLASSDLEIDIALNLDGGGSTGLWLDTDRTVVEIDSIVPVPAVIAVHRR
jgi:hypothetical protein